MVNLLFYFTCTFLLVIHEIEIIFKVISTVDHYIMSILVLVQHVLVKPDVKGIENDVAGPPPSEPE